MPLFLGALINSVKDEEVDYLHLESSSFYSRSKKTVDYQIALYQRSNFLYSSTIYTYLFHSTYSSFIINQTNRNL